MRLQGHPSNAHIHCNARRRTLLRTLAAAERAEKARRPLWTLDKNSSHRLTNRSGGAVQKHCSDEWEHFPSQRVPTKR
jgi:hypothetical protein